MSQIDVLLVYILFYIEPSSLAFYVQSVFILNVVCYASKIPCLERSLRLWIKCIMMSEWMECARNGQWGKTITKWVWLNETIIPKLQCKYQMQSGSAWSSINPKETSLFSSYRLQWQTKRWKQLHTLWLSNLVGASEGPRTKTHSRRIIWFFNHSSIMVKQPIQKTSRLNFNLSSAAFYVLYM